MNSRKNKILKILKDELEQARRDESEEKFVSLYRSFNLFETILSNSAPSKYFTLYENFVYSFNSPLHFINKIFGLIFFTDSNFFNFFTEQFEMYIKEYSCIRFINNKLDDLFEYFLCSNDEKIFIRNFANKYPKYFDLLSMYLMVNSPKSKLAIKDVADTIIKNMEKLDKISSMCEKLSLISDEAEVYSYQYTIEYLNEKNCSKIYNEFKNIPNDLTHKLLILKPELLNAEDRKPLNQICICTDAPQYLKNEVYIKNKIGIARYNINSFIGELDESTLNDKEKEELADLRKNLYTMDERGSFDILPKENRVYSKSYILLEVNNYTLYHEAEFLNKLISKACEKYDVVCTDEKHYTNKDGDYLKNVLFYFTLRDYSVSFRRLQFIDTLDRVQDLCIAANTFYKTPICRDDYIDILEDLPF